MGLDQYLYASFDLYSSIKSDIEDKVNDLYSLMGVEKFKSTHQINHCHIKTQIAYWRKSNEIHNYFVTHCGEGIDECQEIEVSKEDLQELLTRCNSILENNDEKLSEELLPTQSGFFFGSTDYDDYYFESLKHTQEKIQGILNHFQGYQKFIYQASW